MITVGAGTLAGVGMTLGYGMLVGTVGAGMLGIPDGAGTTGAGAGMPAGVGTDLGDSAGAGMLAGAGTTGAGVGMPAGAGIIGVGIMDGTTVITTTMLSIITDVTTEIQ